MKTIAIDFDGVIHKYSKGWQDGSIYDVEVKHSIDALKSLIVSGYSVAIMTARDVHQVYEWFDNHPLCDFNISVLPIDQKFYNETGILGITNRKIVADIYVDDRAICFRGRWDYTLSKIVDFKTWQQ
jgi:hypothetical protein